MAVSVGGSVCLSVCLFVCLSVPFFVVFVCCVWLIHWLIDWLLVCLIDPLFLCVRVCFVVCVCVTVTMSVSVYPWVIQNLMTWMRKTLCLMTDLQKLLALQNENWVGNRLKVYLILCNLQWSCTACNGQYFEITTSCFNLKVRIGLPWSAFALKRFFSTKPKKYYTKRILVITSWHCQPSCSLSPKITPSTLEMELQPWGILGGEKKTRALLQP